MSDNETWEWELVGTHEGPAFLGVWQARAYISERAQGWYAAAEGHNTGREYVYRLPGRKVPSGPYTRAGAESCARQMIGLSADANRPPNDRLVLYQPVLEPGRKEQAAQDVTGGRWTLASGGIAHNCINCGELITSGWSEGPWSQARRFVCASHVEVIPEARPAHGSHTGAAKAERRVRAATADTATTPAGGL